MKAIVTRANEQGEFEGPVSTGFFGPYPMLDTIHHRAREFGEGRPVRVQLFYDDRASLLYRAPQQTYILDT